MESCNERRTFLRLLLTYLCVYLKLKDMGNRLDNLNEYERDMIDKYARNQSYYINLAGSIDDVRNTLRFIPNTVDNICRLNDSIINEKAGKNRGAIINLLEQKLKKINFNNK